MISNEQILNQIEKQIHKAKMEPNGLATREVFAAIRALCDVVLDSTASVNPIQSTPTISAQPITIKENDANGESLFDF